MSSAIENTFRKKSISTHGGAEAEKVVEHRLPPLNRRSADLSLSKAFWLEEEFSVYLPSREILFPLFSLSLFSANVACEGCFFRQLSVCKGKRYRLERERERDPGTCASSLPFSPAMKKKVRSISYVLLPTKCMWVKSVRRPSSGTALKYEGGIRPTYTRPKNLLVWIPG